MRKIVFVCLLAMGIMCSGAIEICAQNENPMSRAKAAAVRAKERVRESAAQNKSTKLSKNSAGFTIGTFVEAFNDEMFGPGLAMKDTDDIMKALQKAGYGGSQRTVRITDEICGEMDTWNHTSYTLKKTILEGTIEIVLSPEDEWATTGAVITFPTTAERDLFLQSAKQMGFKDQGYQECGNDSGQCYSDGSECYYNGTDILVKGNTVKIFFRSEC